MIIIIIMDINIRRNRPRRVLHLLNVLLLE